MTAHRGFDDPFPPVHPLPSLPSSRFHLRLKIQRHDSSRNWAHKLSVNILQKIVHVLVARLLLTWARDSAPRPNQAVRFFCPELSSKSGSWGEDNSMAYKKSEIARIYARWLETSDKTRFNGEKRADQRIGFDYEQRWSRWEGGRKRNYARYYSLFRRKDRKRKEGWCEILSRLEIRFILQLTPILSALWFIYALGIRGRGSLSRDVSRVDIKLLHLQKR